MWAQLNGAKRFILILGTSYILGAFIAPPLTADG